MISLWKLFCHVPRLSFVSCFFLFFFVQIFVHFYILYIFQFHYHSSSWQRTVSLIILFQSRDVQLFKTHSLISSGKLSPVSLFPFFLQFAVFLRISTHQWPANRIRSNSNNRNAKPSTILETQNPACQAPFYRSPAIRLLSLSLSLSPSLSVFFLFRVLYRGDYRMSYGLATAGENIAADSRFMRSSFIVAPFPTWLHVPRVSSLVNSRLRGSCPRFMNDYTEKFQPFFSPSSLPLSRTDEIVRKEFVVSQTRVHNWSQQFISFLYFRIFHGVSNVPLRAANTIDPGKYFRDLGYRDT